MQNLLFIRVLLLRRLFISLLKPFDEGLGSSADLFAGSNVDVLLASLGAPADGDLFAYEIVVIVELEDLDDLVENLGLLLELGADEALGSAEESLLVLL